MPSTFTQYLTEQKQIAANRARLQKLSGILTESGSHPLIEQQQVTAAVFKGRYPTTGLLAWYGDSGEMIFFPNATEQDVDAAIKATLDENELQTYYDMGTLEPVTPEDLGSQESQGDYSVVYIMTPQEYAATTKGFLGQDEGHGGTFH